MNSRTSLFIFTAAAMTAFAANSLFCRAALGEMAMDPLAFTLIRLGSGALFLHLIAWWRPSCSGSPLIYGKRGFPSLMLFTYAMGFSWAYQGLDTGTGALILFGAVQLTMFSGAWLGGTRPGMGQVLGMGLAFLGLVWLFLPGVSAPPTGAGVTMALAGIAWGAYSMAGKGEADPLGATAANFILALGWALAAAIPMAIWSPVPDTRLSIWGIGLALLSGALASGAGYAVWYKVVARLNPATAGVVQLSVPILAFAGGSLFLGEPLTPRYAVAATLVLLGIGIALISRHPN